MPFYIQLILIFILFIISSLGPGYIITQRFRLPPFETLCLSISVSHLLIYLISFLIYLLNLPILFYFLTSLGFFGVTLRYRKDIGILACDKEVTGKLIFFLFLLLWGLVLITLVRHYSGGLWARDWFEHYERSLFFLNHMPLEKRFLGYWTLTARPPLMNLIAGFYMGQIGQKFYIFQLICLLLNTLVFLPCCLIGDLFHNKNKRWILLLTAVFVFNPMFIQNINFTWTKLYTAYFVILGTYFYVRAIRSEEVKYLVFSFVNISTGFLVHFSAGPYGLFLVLHYLIFVSWKRDEPLKEIFLSLILSLFILFTWFGWSFYTFGVGDTLLSNSTIIGSTGSPLGKNIIKIGSNIYNTLIPHPFRNVSLEAIKQGSFLGYIRDYMFWIYQVNLIFAIGITNGILSIWLAVKELMKRSEASNERIFWVLFLLFNTVVGISVHGDPDQYGLAHICLQPLVLLTLVFLSIKIWDAPKLLKNIFLLGLVIDFVLGIFLHFSMQNKVFGIIEKESGEVVIKMSYMLSRIAASNWYEKEVNNLIFLGDFFSIIAIPVKILLVTFGSCMLFYIGKRLNSRV